MHNANEVVAQLTNQTLNGKGDSDAHLMAIFGIVVQMQPNVTIELGVRSGTTTIPLLLGSWLSNGQLISVDIDPPGGFVPPEFMKGSWNFVLGDSIAFLEAWEEEYKDVTMDVVYIDDWHAYEHVKKELELIEKYITPESIILLHDCMSGTWRGPWDSHGDKVRQGFTSHYMPPDYHSDTGEFAGGGPATAVRELDLDKWEYVTLPVYHGLTILRKKEG